MTKHALTDKQIIQLIISRRKRLFSDDFERFSDIANRVIGKLEEKIKERR